MNKRHIRWVPLYNIDPQSGARVEIFYADRALAASFGWLWRRPARLSAGEPARLLQFRDALDSAAVLKASTRLLMPGDRAAGPCRFFAPKLSIIVHNFTCQVLDQLLSHPAVLLAS